MAPVASAPKSKPVVEKAAATKASSSAAKVVAPEVVVTKKTAKAAAPAAVAPAAVAPAAVAPAVDAAAPAVPAAVAVAVIKPSHAAKLADAVDSMNTIMVERDIILKAMMKNARQERKLRESIGKHSTNAKKAETVRVEKALKKKANGNPTGLHMPALASDVLNAFMGNAASTWVKRGDAAACIREYVKANNLKEGMKGGNARVDAKLDKLFPGLSEINVFGLQKHMKDHFAKKEKKTA